MRNTLRGSKKAAKVMKIRRGRLNARLLLELERWYETIRVLESTDVKQFGIRARQLEPEHELKPKKLYFLIELPKRDDLDLEKVPRRAGLVTHASAKDRLQSLKLSRGAVSDLSSMVSNPSSIMFKEATTTSSKLNSGTLGESCRFKMRLPRAGVAKLMDQSGDKAEAAQMILALCLAKYSTNDCPTSALAQQ